MYKNSWFKLLGIAFILLFASITLRAQPNLDEGKSLFRAKCAQCHNRNMVDDLTGPALGGTQERWADYPQEDLYAWIRNSQKMIAEGHPRATELWDQWGPTVMNNFTELTDEQIESILAYIDGVYTGEIGGPAVAAQEGTGAVDTDKDNSALFVVLLVILVVLALIMARIIAVLNNIAHTRETGEPAPRVTIRDILTSRTVVGLGAFAIIVLGGYTTVNNAIMIGRQQGYEPQQPIKFSHATHAGLQKIDCQYCHDGARRSKHSVIPAANTCMNCHRAIKKGSQYGTAELTKIYASIGYNPLTDRYVNDYDNISQDSVEALYRAWITSEMLKEKGLEKPDNRTQMAIDEQWEGIVTSLTNEQKTKIQGPIEWKRVHNLPDHVYFNHAQHVTAGQLECQQCHGKVEEMEVLGQYSPLSMGWCINCHRQSEVKGFKDNPYYENTYRDYHNALKNGDKDKVTVEDIGGLECQKCHY